MGIYKYKIKTHLLSEHLLTCPSCCQVVVMCTPLWNMDISTLLSHIWSEMDWTAYLQQRSIPSIHGPLPKGQPANLTQLWEALESTWPASLLNAFDTTLLEKRVSKGFFGCPQVELFWVLCRTLCVKGSTWNSKGFVKGFFNGNSQRRFQIAYFLLTLSMPRWIEAVLRAKWGG